MNNLNHSIDSLFEQHRSIRDFSQQKVDKQLINEIIQKSIDGTSVLPPPFSTVLICRI